jgi:hypothetical protein
VPPTSKAHSARAYSVLAFIVKDWNLVDDIYRRLLVDIERDVALALEAWSKWRQHGERVQLG